MDQGETDVAILAVQETLWKCYICSITLLILEFRHLYTHSKAQKKKKKTQFCFFFFLGRKLNFALYIIN